MLSFTATDDWRMSYPGALIGVLEVTGIVNVDSSSVLDDRKRAAEARLRERYHGFTRSDFLALPVMAAYERHYKRFDKTYHVQLQVESIVLKGKRLPSVSPLVDANFMAEVETLVLTAGHDVEHLQGQIVIDISQPGDQQSQMNGATKDMRAGDMVMRDDGGICCSIIYGQDNRSPISSGTTHVLYVAYAPPGVPAEVVNAQMQSIEASICLFAPTAIVEQHRLITA